MSDSRFPSKERLKKVIKSIKKANHKVSSSGADKS